MSSSSKKMQLADWLSLCVYMLISDCAFRRSGRVTLMPPMVHQICSIQVGPSDFGLSGPKLSQSTRHILKSTVLQPDTHVDHLKQQKYTDRSFFLKSGVKEWQKRFSNWPKFPGSRMAMEKVRDITRWDFKDEKQCFLLYIPGSQWSDARIGKIRFLVLVSAYSRLQLEGVTILQIGCNECVYNGSHVSSNKKSFTFGNGFEMEETSFHHRGNLLAKTYHLAFNVQVT